MWKFSLSKTVRIVFLFCAVTATPSAAQTFTTLANFNGTNGFGFKPALVQGTDGNFYGTTGYGGDFTCNITLGMGCGTVFRITSGGTLATVHTFSGPDGWIPSAGLVEATDGNFYGTTEGGGANRDISTCFAGCGTVFKMTPAGTLTTVYNFCAQTNCTDGAGPATLVQATDGNFYGTSSGGSNNSCSGSCGTVFRITPNGKLSTLYNFCAQTNCTDGYNASGLLQATDGNFYGTNSAGGSNNNCTGGCGTVFRITPRGALTTLHSFNFADGWIPSGLVQATDGNFYGTTQGGGANSLGTVFKITLGGTLTTLHSFGAIDGGTPVGPLVQATDGNFYGTTDYGGNLMCNAPHGCGVIFRITPGGALTTLHNFIYADGIYPGGGLVHGTDGNLYGATFQGGNISLCNTFGCGTVFSLSVGLGPFVETMPTSGAVGTAVVILGNNLTGTTGVTFNGTAATFTVVSSSEIQTIVPVGATTGIVQVTTPSGTLSSNVPFQVTKTRKRLVQVTSE